MAVLFFSCFNRQGETKQCGLRSPDIESGFEALTTLTSQGDWQLGHVALVDGPGKAISLPTEVFDGSPMKEPLKRLQQEWEELLFQLSLLFLPEIESILMLYHNLRFS